MTGGAAGAFRCVLARDLACALRRRAEALTPLGFFVIVASLFPLGVGAEPNLLRAMGPGVVWVAALLAVMLSMSRLFGADLADGTLEQLVLAPQPLSLLVAGKMLAHWATSVLPVVVASPLIGLQFDLPADALGVLVASLLLGTPSLCLVGGIGAALTVGVRGGGVLMAVLVLPLYAPVLIFGAGAAAFTAAGMSPGGHLSLLAAYLSAAAVFAPLATATAVRIALD